MLTAWTLYQTRDFACALEKANELISLDPAFWQGYLQSANCLVELGNTARAVDNARKAVELGGESPLPVYVLSFALAQADDIAEARSVAERLAGAALSTYIPPYFVGMSLLGAGEVDRAFEQFDKAQDEKSAWMVWWGTEPKLDRVRKDERYRSILKATGNPIINFLESPTGIPDAGRCRT